MIKKIYKKLLPEKIRIKIRLFSQKIISPLYSGNKYYCNCCDRSFKKFLAHGNKIRPNAKCPYCQSLERVRLLDYYLMNEVKFYQYQGINVLHFAPEACLFKKFSKLNINYFDCDANPANARTVIDITNIGFGTDYFDIIICSHVLGHVPDEKKAISEMYRVLKPGGIALVMTLINPNSQSTLEDPSIQHPDDRLRFYGESDLCRLHGLDFEKRLSIHGFDVNVIDYRENFSKEQLIRFSLGNGERELIFRCEK
jgi:SAM-dependent methyltransferase